MRRREELEEEYNVFFPSRDRRENEGERAEIAPRYDLGLRNRRKRQRRDPHTSWRGETRERTTTSTTNSPTPAPLHKDLGGEAQETMVIKTEEERRVARHLASQHSVRIVKVYAGSDNKIFLFDLETLEKSRVLRSLISESEGESPFIMHPKLTTLNVDHFGSVHMFMTMDEYVPCMVANPEGEHVLPKMLDGLQGAQEYRTEVVRAGHVYVIAKGLGIPTLEDLVFKKISQSEYHAYGPRCLLDLAMAVFSRRDGNDEKGFVTEPDKRMQVMQGKATEPETAQAQSGSQPETGDRETAVEDRLEAWLIDRLAMDFHTITLSHAERFWQVANHGVCNSRGFARRVLQKKIEQWNAAGVDTVTIEDDD